MLSCAWAIPQAAPPLRRRIFRVSGLRPRMSQTENIIVMSLMPTNDEVSPEATVETMTFGSRRAALA